MSDKIIIAIDAMGGDNAPKEIIKGAVCALEENNNLKIILVGKQEIIDNELKNYDIKSYENLEILDAQDIITNDDSPTWAIKNKKESSIVKGLNLVKDKSADGFISAGSTGALLSCATLLLKRLPKISRPALATLLPNLNGVSLLLDSGANVDCKAIYLEQFAKMGSLYMEHVMKIKNPRVALVNIGIERSKGSILLKEAYELLGGSKINFIGNIEARDIPYGSADVLVCDGFVGNVILKHTEGLTKGLLHIIKNELDKNILRKLGGLFAKSAFSNIKNKFDYNKIGGAPFLGLNSIIIKVHGSSNYNAIKNAAKQCIGFIESNIISQIKDFPGE